MASYAIYLVFLVGSLPVAIWMIARMWHLRASPGARGLIISILCSAQWSLTYAFEIIDTNLAAKIMWAKLEYFGISFIALGLLMLGLHFSGRGQWLTFSRLIWLTILPIFNVLAALANEAHGQIWSDVQLTNNQLFGPLTLTHGLWFYIFAAFQYTLLLATTVFLFQMAFSGQDLYRSQARIMLAGMIIPWIANFIYISRLNPFPGLDPTPVAFTLTSVLLSIGYQRYHFLELLPVAHSSVFNAMKDGVIVLDRKERIVDINPVGMMILNGKDLIGKTITDLFPLWDDWRASGPGGEIDSEIAMNSDGGMRMYNLRTTLLSSRSQQASGQVAILSDITEQKQAQEQMAEANRMKTRLLASVSHDLRAPLGAVIGYAEMLKDGTFGDVNSEQENAASEILDSASQLLTFVNNLIGQAQIETGRMVLREQPFEPAELTSTNLSTLNFHARKKRLVFEQFIDPDLPPRIIGDIYWLRQIVLNLVNNAIKFTEKGLVRLCILRASQNCWAIEVIDTGIGIPPESRGMIFEAFKQADSASTRRQIGSGLGLAIVKELAAQMNGEITLTSEVGKGSTFMVILPLREPKDESQKAEL